MKYFGTVLILVACTTTFVFSNAQESPSRAEEQPSISPDKKWEYQPDESAPKIVKADTNEVALDLSDQPAGNGFSFATVIWAPDSKRLAFNYGQGRTHATSLHQLRDGKWVALDSPSSDNEIEKRANDIVADQLKAQGLSEKKLSKQGKYLRFIWWTVNVDRWVDSNTAIAYASLRRVAARRDAPGKMDDGYGTDLLFTLRFDGARQMEDRQNASDVGERSRRAPMSSFLTFVAIVLLTIGRDFSKMPPHDAN